MDSREYCNTVDAARKAKEQAKAELERVRKRKEQLSLLNGVDYSLAVGGGSGYHSGGGAYSQIERVLDDERAAEESFLDKLNAWVRVNIRFWRLIDSIPDLNSIGIEKGYLYMGILNNRYLEGLTLDKTAEQMGYDACYIRRKAKAAYAALQMVLDAEAGADRVQEGPEKGASDAVSCCISCCTTV